MHIKNTFRLSSSNVNLLTGFEDIREVCTIICKAKTTFQIAIRHQWIRWKPLLPLEQQWNPYNLYFCCRNNYFKLWQNKPHIRHQIYRRAVKFVINAIKTHWAQKQNMHHHEKDILNREKLRQRKTSRMRIPQNTPSRIKAGKYLTFWRLPNCNAGLARRDNFKNKAIS